MHKPSYDTGYNDGCANSALGILIVLSMPTLLAVVAAFAR